LVEVKSNNEYALSEEFEATRIRALIGELVGSNVAQARSSFNQAVAQRVAAEGQLEALFVDTIPPAPDAASITLRATARPQRRPVPLLAQLSSPRQPILGWARVVMLASCLGVGIMIGILSPIRNHDPNVLDLIDGSAFEVNDE
jgi:hypothetical protein